MNQTENYRGLSLTPRALEHVRKYLRDEGGRGLRVGVKRTGCSGWAYTVEIAADPAGDDQVFNHEGVAIFVSADALALIDGTEVDFVTQGLNRIFTFSNPNVHEECGCGESFSVKSA